MQMHIVIKVQGISSQINTLKSWLISFLICIFDIISNFYLIKKKLLGINFSPCFSTFHLTHLLSQHIHTHCLLLILLLYQQWIVTSRHHEYIIYDIHLTFIIPTLLQHLTLSLFLAVQYCLHASFNFIIYFIPLFNIYINLIFNSKIIQ